MKIRGKKTETSGVNQIFTPAEAIHQISKTENVRHVEAGVNVLLSERTKEIDRAKEILKTIPDIRLEKTNSVREMINNGKYYVDSYTLAKKIVNESLLESIRILKNKKRRKRG